MRIWGEGSVFEISTQIVHVPNDVEIANDIVGRRGCIVYLGNIIQGVKLYVHAEM